MKRFINLGLAAWLAFAASFAVAQTATVQSVNSLFNKAQTYRMASGSITAASTPTDVATLCGSATKTIYVKRVSFNGTMTTAGAVDVLLVKRSTANSGGTSGALTEHPLDSTNGTATAVGVTYTANPTVGTGVTVAVDRVTINAPATAAANRRAEWNFGDGINQHLVLRGTAQCLAFNLGGATTSGLTFAVEAEWMEL